MMSITHHLLRWGIKMGDYMVRSKKFYTVVALIAMSALLVTGTFAWTNFDSRIINSILGQGTSGGIPDRSPGATLHNDFEEGKDYRDVYVENWGSEPLIVRVWLAEYMEIGEGAGNKNDSENNHATPVVSTALIDDPNTWEPFPGLDENGLRASDVDVPLFGYHWRWTMGGEKRYFPAPTEQRGTQDSNGVEFVSTRSPVGNDVALLSIYRTTLYAEVLSMDEWISKGMPLGHYWVVDVDGYSYWAAPLEPEEATGLLLHKVELYNRPTEDFYYAINVAAHMASIDNTPDNYERMLIDASANAALLINGVADAIRAGSNEIPTDVPSPTEIPNPTEPTDPEVPPETPALTGTPIPTEIPSPIASPIPTEIPPPIASPIPTEIPPPIASPIPTAIPSPIATPVPSPIATPILTITPVPQQTLTIVPSIWRPNADGNSQRLTITSDSPWSISSDTPWLTASITSGTGNQELTMYITENPTIERRVGVLTIRTADGSVYRTVTVTQRDAVIPTLYEREVIRLVNIERANHGVAPLQWHDSLAVVARNHSVDMARRDYFAHRCPNGRNAGSRIGASRIPFRWYAETLSRGVRPEWIVNSQMNSPQHRDILLYPGVTHIGVGFHEFYWTLKFIR